METLPPEMIRSQWNSVLGTQHNDFDFIQFWKRKLQPKWISTSIACKHKKWSISFVNIVKILRIDESFRERMLRKISYKKCCRVRSLFVSNRQFCDKEHFFFFIPQMKLHWKVKNLMQSWEISRTKWCRVSWIGIIQIFSPTFHREILFHHFWPTCWARQPIKLDFHG